MAAAGGAMGFGFPSSVAEGGARAYLEACVNEDQGRVKEVDDVEQWGDLEPFFFDEAAVVREHNSAMRREELRHEEEARQAKAYWDALHRIREYDPKHGTINFTRVYFVGDITTFDLDEESPLGPMRETDASIDVVDGIVCKEGKELFLPAESADILASYRGEHLVCRRKEFVPCASLNVLSVKIVSSDVGFPINVYGTVIARDNLDLKCVYLFRRDRGHSQLILTKDESLIMTGPKRGLMLSCSVHFEIDLKIKGAKMQKDRQLSKGYLTFNGKPYIHEDKIEVESQYLDTRLSNVKITHAVVKSAVEATFAVEVVQGRFYGEITAHTTSIRDSIVLHDSRFVKAMDGNGKGVVQLLRRVVAVCLKEKLIVTIAARTGDGKTKSVTAKFTPGVNGAEEKEISCGFLKMRLKATWSIIRRKYLIV